MTLRAMLKLPAPTDPAEFDAQVADVLRVRHANVHLVALGRNGQSQGGIDGMDPLAGPGRQLVWQSTTRTAGLEAKLVRDLATLDRGRGMPILFIFAVGCERDARVQGWVEQLSAERRASGRCAVEILFWEEIRQLLLDNHALGAKWYPDFYPRTGGPNEPIRSAMVADVTDLPQREDGLAIWQMGHLARICPGTDPSHLRDIRGALMACRAASTSMRMWPSGKNLRIGTSWYYPNGKAACIGDTWYYPNGKHACIGDTWYYPNGKHACIGRAWYRPTGESTDEGALLTSVLAILSEGDQTAATAGLLKLIGQLRRLALVDLAWKTARQPPGRLPR